VCDRTIRRRAYFKSAKSEKKRVEQPRKKGFLASRSVGANTAFGADGVGKEMQTNNAKWKEIIDI